MTTLKKEIEDILHPEKKKLNPPMAPPKLWHYETPRESGILGIPSTNRKKEPIVSETTVKDLNADNSVPIRSKSQTDSKQAIDFSYLANNSSFQRAIIEFIKKFVPGFENVKHRGSKEIMRESFDQNAHNYREVMAELKLKLQEKRVE